MKSLRAMFPVLALPFLAAASCGDSSADRAIQDGGVEEEAPQILPEVDAGPDLAPSTPVLTAVALGYSNARLDWTAPTDELGHAAAYDIRMSPAPITNEAEFLAAELVKGAPVPAPSGKAEKVMLSGLTSGATIHFAMRARDATYHWSPVSNDASLTLFARARFLISEVAPQNGAADGYDFIELVAVEGGRTDGITITQVGGTLATLGTFTVAKDDRVVVHLTGTPCPTGCADESASGSKTQSTATFSSTEAWDLYADATGITGTDNVISVLDNGIPTDVLAFSNRDGDASAAMMTAFATAASAGSWVFPVAPVDGVSDCDTQRAAVAVSASDSACGGFATFSNGKSLNRGLGFDTNSKRDFYVATMTPGAGNFAPSAPNVTAVNVVSASEIAARFDQEMDPASALPLSLTLAGGLTLATTSLEEVNVVRVQTASQVEGAAYSITLGTTLKSLQGVPLASPYTSAFCGFSPSGSSLVINEIAPNVAGGTDLVELLVTKGGALSGVQLRATPSADGSGSTLLATLPAICGVAGDIVVIHLHPSAATAGALALVSETMKKDEAPASAYSANYDTAWDILSTNATELSSLRAPLFLRAANGITMDAVALYGSGTPPQSYVDSVAYFQSVGAWLPANCGGVACDATSVIAISASMAGVDTTPSGITVRRAPGTSTRTGSDFSVGPGSMGVGN